MECSKVFFGILGLSAMGTLGLLMTDTDHAECMSTYALEQKTTAPDVAIKRLSEAMAEYTEVYDRWTARPPRAPSKGRPDPYAVAREAIGSAASGVHFALTDLVPLEDYPLAVLGLEDDLREHAFPSPSGHGREHLKGTTALIDTVIELAPETRASGAEFIDPLNETYTFTSDDLRQLDSRRPPFSSIVALMGNAVEAYPAFEEALLTAISDPKFASAYRRNLYRICEAWPIAEDHI